jgi:hypothetical protein
MPTNFDPHYGGKQNSEPATGLDTGARTELVYGECNGGLTFIKKKYALEIGDFKGAVANSSTWGELKSRITEEYYLETVEKWKEDEYCRRMDEEEIEEWQILDPKPEDAFDAAEMPGYLDMDWPEFAPGMMDEWVSKEIVERYGGYVESTLSGDYPLIDFENEEKVVSLLEEQGYVCIRDDGRIWDAIWGR